MTILVCLVVGFIAGFVVGVVYGSSLKAEYLKLAQDSKDRAEAAHNRITGVERAAAELWAQAGFKKAVKGK